MEIVIKIPKEIYIGEQTAGILPILVDAIGKGIPLPAHHGRLIDADAIQKYQIDTFGQRLLVIDTAPTIIEGSDSE